MNVCMGSVYRLLAAACQASRGGGASSRHLAGRPPQPVGARVWFGLDLMDTKHIPGIT